MTNLGDTEYIRAQIRKKLPLIFNGVYKYINWMDVLDNMLGAHTDSYLNIRHSFEQINL